MAADPREAVVAAHLISPFVAADEIKLKDATDLLSQTPHPIAQLTLERLCRKHGVPMVKYHHANHASWSQLLKLHRDWVASRT